MSNDPSIEAETRLDNLNQLVSALTGYTEGNADTSLASYLEQVSLVADVDKLDKNVEAISLMTMHAAKGLEFNQTFVCGLERNLMPHGNIDDEAGLEEERRLLYVAMTRARQRMYLTYARQRMRFNEILWQTVSPFLAAIPKDTLVRSGLPSRGGGGDGGGFSRQHSGGRGPRKWGSPASASSWGAAIRGNSSWAAAASAERHREAEDDGVSIQRGPVGPFQPGSKAKHVSFGNGEVLAIEGHGKLARVTIRFGRFGVKKVLARFLEAL